MCSAQGKSGWVKRKQRKKGEGGGERRTEAREREGTTLSLIRSINHSFYKEVKIKMW